MPFTRSDARALTGLGVLLVAGGLVLARQPAQQPAPAQPKRDPHANEVPNPRTPPRVVTPGATPGAPPSDAIVLFDGTDLSQWQSAKGGPVQWTAADSAMTVKPGSGGIRTRDEFGDVQLHIEWATPSPAKGTGQDRGNSGVFLQGIYEIQVLDSFENTTYWHGSAGSIYKQYPPLVNASRKPGEWQVYDIVYRGPRFNEDGRVTRRATFTVFHNGVLIQDHAEVMGVTTNEGPPYYRAHGEKGPLSLQDHDHLVRFRNIWLREI